MLNVHMLFSSYLKNSLLKEAAKCSARPCQEWHSTDGTGSSPWTCLLKASPSLSTAVQSVTIVTLNPQNDFTANVPAHLQQNEKDHLQSSLP
jgi:hypothetical protein